MTAPLTEVRVLAAPVPLWDEAAAHTQELMREFALLRIGAEAGTTRPVPQRLLDLVAELRTRYAGTSAAQEAEFEQAVAAGRPSIDLVYAVPDGVGPACQQLLDLLDEADAYCADGGMITLLTPPEQVAFRRWYLGEFVRQTAGADPQPWPGRAPDLGVLADPVRVERVEALVRSRAPDERLDELAALACRLTGAPVATVSLVGDRAQVVAAAHGLQLSGPARRVPLDASLCAFPAATGTALVVPDARTHPWVSDRPAVRDGSVACYLGVPLRDDDGHVVGTLAVHGPRARTWAPHHVEALEALAQSAARELARSTPGPRPEAPGAGGALQLELAVEAAQLGVFSYEVASGELAWDERMLELHGRGAAGSAPRTTGSPAAPTTAEVLERIVHPDDLPAVRAAVQQALQTLGEVDVEYRALLPDGTERWITLRGRVVPDLLDQPARVLGAAFDRSRERRLADSLERAGARLQVLASAGAALSATLSPHEVLDVLVEVLVPDQAAGLVLAVTPDVAELLGHGHAAARTDLHPARLKHADPVLQPVLEAVIALAPLSVTASSGAGRAVRTGESQLLERVPDELLRARAADPAHLDQMRSLNTGTSLSVPLLTPRGTSGALTVTAAPGQVLDELLVTDLARRAAVALENALDFARAQRVTRELQTSLLPRTTATLAGVQVASRYLPASSGALAGGDFFTTLVVEGRLVAVLGDVMGHGAVSAARAGQLHAVVAALALQGLSPGGLLGRLSADIGTVMDLELATALVCSYDPVTRELVAATAGHPCPLVAPGDGGPAWYLELTPGAPLGVAPDAYPQESVRLGDRDVVVLFSDGLVERRGESLTRGLERLRGGVEALVRGGASAAEALACGVLDTMASPSEDDVALLVVTQD